MHTGPGLSSCTTAPFAPLSSTPKKADWSWTHRRQTPAENQINSSKHTTGCSGDSKSLTSLKNPGHTATPTKTGSSVWARGPGELGLVCLEAQWIEIHVSKKEKKVTLTHKKCVLKSKSIKNGGLFCFYFFPLNTFWNICMKKRNLGYLKIKRITKSLHSQKIGVNLILCEKWKKHILHKGL